MSLKETQRLLDGQPALVTAVAPVHGVGVVAAADAVLDVVDVVSWPGWCLCTRSLVSRFRGRGDLLVCLDARDGM